VKLILLFFKKYNDYRLLIFSSSIILLVFVISLGNLNNILAQEKDYDLKEVKDGIYVISLNGIMPCF